MQARALTPAVHAASRSEPRKRQVRTVRAGCLRRLLILKEDQKKTHCSSLGDRWEMCSSRYSSLFSPSDKFTDATAC